MGQAEPALHATGDKHALQAEVYGTTVHVVSRLTPSVLSFLQPTVLAMSATGAPQLLLRLDTTAHRIPIFPPSVRQRLVPDQAFAWQRSNGLHKALVDLLQRECVSTLHLHGLLAAVAGLRALRRKPEQPIEVLFTPHASRGLAFTGAFQTALARTARRGLIGTRHVRTIVSVPGETDRMDKLAGHGTQIVESAVPAVYFEAPRNEARRPLLIASTALPNTIGVDRYARIAVLLGDDQLGISFNWLGTVDAAESSLMKAAGIGRFDAETDALRAHRLSSAWVFVLPVEERGFPIRLAEAMAAGLACVVLDSPVHKHVVEDGKTGFLCPDVPTMLRRIAELIDSQELRQRMGHAARCAATDRFSGQVFERHLMVALGLGMSSG